MRDAPLVSARAAGIPKPAHCTPPVPALIPLSEALPMMGIALLRLGCVHHFRTTPGDGTRCSFSRGGGTCCRISRSGGARFSFFYGGGAQQCTLSLSCHGQRNCYHCRTSRGGGNRCRTFGGVSGIHSPTLCLSCHSQKGCP